MTVTKCPKCGKDNLIWIEFEHIHACPDCGCLIESKDDTVYVIHIQLPSNNYSCTGLSFRI